MSKIFKKFIIFSFAVVLSAQSVSAQSRHPVPPPPPPGGHFLNSLSDAFGELFVMLWALDNLLVNFDDYPYANGKYLKFYTDMTGSTNSRSSQTSDISDVTDEIADIAVENQNRNDGQFYRFTLDDSVFWYPKTGIYGNETRFEGYFWKFFGPYFENTLYTNGPIQYFTTDNLLGNLKLGMQFSILHSNFLDVSWFLDWTYWYGIETEYGKTSAGGIDAGMVFRSYPVNPLLIEYRFDFQTITSSSDEVIFNSNLELGFELSSPLEIYGAWRYCEDDFFGRGKSNAVAVGLKYNF